ncbi:MAG: PleD family two-component system response regulator [Candidatus Cryptobacteroides sp.]
MDIGALGNIDCSNISLMIVDDIPINTKLLGKLLEPVGFKSLQQYNNSQLALDSVKTVRPDIILLDVMMPGIDGFAFLSSIREDRSLDNVRIIMVSAVSESEEVLRAGSMGANDYLTKPINAKRLYTSIANQIQIIQGGNK